MCSVRDVRGEFPSLRALHKDVVLSRLPNGGGASLPAKTLADNGLTAVAGGGAGLESVYDVECIMDTSTMP